MSQQIEKNMELIKKYPWLIPHDAWTGEIVKDYDYSFTELDDMSCGWRIAFGELFCEDIEKELEKFKYENQYHIIELKSKYGELRLYDNGVPPGCKVPEIIENYAVISGYICENCGELDVPQTHGWIMPVCKKCICKMNYKNPEEIWDKIDKEQAPHMIPTKRYYRTFTPKCDKNWVEHEVDITELVERIRAYNAERKRHVFK